MLINDTSRMEWERLPVSSRNMRTSRKLLREGNALPGMGLYAVLVKLHDGEEAFTAPWHRHNFSQIRIGVKGHLHFGPNLDCEPGQVGFFPGGAYYGPEEIIGAEYLLLQWGRDWVTRAQDKAAIAELSERLEQPIGQGSDIGRETHAQEIEGIDFSGGMRQAQEVDGPFAAFEKRF